MEGFSWLHHSFDLGNLCHRGEPYSVRLLGRSRLPALQPGLLGSSAARNSLAPRLTEVLQWRSSSHPRFCRGHGCSCVDCACSPSHTGHPHAPYRPHSAHCPRTPKVGTLTLPPRVGTRPMHTGARERASLQAVNSVLVHGSNSRRKSKESERRRRRQRDKEGREEGEKEKEGRTKEMRRARQGDVSKCGQVAASVPLLFSHRATHGRARTHACKHRPDKVAPWPPASEELERICGTCKVHGRKCFSQRPKGGSNPTNCSPTAEGWSVVHMCNGDSAFRRKGF